jgi:thiol-disulfide isomerase/thioredoxin
MSLKRSFLFTVFTVAVSLLSSVSANAADFAKAPFEKELFDKLQANGEVVLVDVYAPWCPTCKKQQKVIGQYFSANPESKVKVLVVDYDNQTEWVKYFKAPRQSTLYLYKNGEQKWFSVAETRKAKIFAAIDSVVK